MIKGMVLRWLFVRSLRMKIRHKWLPSVPIVVVTPQQLKLGNICSSCIGWASNHQQGSRDFLWIQCKITSPLVPQLHQREEAGHAGSKVSFVQAPSSTSKSQDIASKFRILPTLLSNAWPYKHYLLWTIEFYIPAHVSHQHKSRASVPSSHPHPVAYNLLVALDSISPPSAPSPERSGPIIRQIPHIPSHFLNWPLIFLFQLKLSCPQRLLILCSLFNWWLFSLPDPSYHWV